MVQLLWEVVWQLLKQLNMELPYNLAIPLLNIANMTTQKLVHAETTQMPITWGMDKQNVV